MTRREFNIMAVIAVVALFLGMSLVASFSNIRVTALEDQLAASELEVTHLKLVVNDKQQQIVTLQDVVADDNYEALVWQRQGEVNFYGGTFIGCIVGMNSLGFGGAQVGQHCSRMVVSGVAQDYYNDPDVWQAVEGIDKLIAPIKELPIYPLGR